MKKFLICIVVFAVVLTVRAQTITFNGVKSFSRDAFNCIMVNGQIIGYSLFGSIDKASKNESVYQLIILDNNLEETHRLEFNRSNDTYFVGSAFNGSYFCFEFLEVKEKTIEYLIVGKDGNINGTYRITNVPEGEISLVIKDVISSSENLIGIPGFGFARHTEKRANGFKMQIEAFSNRGIKEWTGNSGVSDSQRAFEIGSTFYVDDKFLITKVSTRNKFFSMTVSSNIICHDIKNGELLFNIPMGENKTYNLLPEGATYDSINKTFYIYGEFAKVKDIVSLGIFIKELDSTGSVIKETYSTWQEDILEATPSEVKNKCEKDLFVAIHKIIRTSDGNFFVIGEQFKKGMNGGAIPLAILGANSKSFVKVNTYNIMVYKFDQNLKIRDVTMIEKNKTDVYLPRGAGLNGTTTLGDLVRRMKGFDYEYTTVSSDRKTFNSAYVNYDRYGKPEDKFVVGNIFYSEDKKIQTDKLSLPIRSTTFWTKAAKPGYVCIFEYFGEEKKLVIRLEKLNT